MRPIDGEMVLHKIDREIEKCNSGLAKGILEFLRIQVDSMPTLEVAPIKYGEWLHTQYEDKNIGKWHRWNCSVCGALKEYFTASTENECHICGAKMRERKEA